jgi:predicted DsbA family dithiol-disulfide isomerase
MIEKAQANQAALAQAQNLPPNQRFQKMAEAAGLIEFYSARGIAREQALQCLADGDKAQAKQCLSDSKKLQQLLDMTKKAMDSGITHTPTFVIDGKVSDVTTWEELEPQLKAALGGNG